MDAILCILQLVVALGILNVWLIRFSKPSPYRGGNATNMVEEFGEYGLSAPLVWIVGTLKVLAAIGLILGLFVPTLTLPSALLLVFLMTAAVSMHIRIKDKAHKSAPAATILLLSLVVVIL